LASKAGNNFVVVVWHLKNPPNRISIAEKQNRMKRLSSGVPSCQKAARIRNRSLDLTLNSRSAFNGLPAMESKVDSGSVADRHGTFQWSLRRLFPGDVALRAFSCRGCWVEWDSKMVSLNRQKKCSCYFHRIKTGPAHLFFLSPASFVVLLVEHFLTMLGLFWHFEIGCWRKCSHRRNDFDIDIVLKNFFKAFYSTSPWRKQVAQVEQFPAPEPKTGLSL